MIKQISITFDFNTETEVVSNIKTTGSAEKKRTTTKKLKEPEDSNVEALVTLEPNKLVFNTNAANLIGIEYEDRIVIKWVKVGKTKVMSPIIGKDTAFDEEGSGNKVTKSNTVTYKGKANTVLAEFGSQFKLTEYQEGIYNLVPLNGSIKPKELTLEKVIENAEEEELDLLVDDLGDDTEIDELQYKL